MRTCLMIIIVILHFDLFDVIAGVVVARVRMSKMTTTAYGSAVRALVECCNNENGGDIVNSLKGIIVDWCSAQVNGIKFAFGESRAEELLRGCQVKMCHCLILQQLHVVGA